MYVTFLALLIPSPMAQIDYTPLFTKRADAYTLTVFADSIRRQHQGHDFASQQLREHNSTAKRQFQERPSEYRLFERKGSTNFGGVR